MSNLQNALVQRNMLKQHRSWAAKYGIAPEDIRPQTLLLFGKLDPSKETYYFDAAAQSTSVCPIENRLKESSLFFANLFGMGILKAPTITVATVVTETPAGAPILHYPDKTVFPTAGSASTLSEAQALEMVFHGRLTFKTDQKVRLDEMACEVFRSAPDLQSGAAAHPSQPLTLIDLSTSFFMWGNRKNIFTLQLPSTGGDRTNIKGASSQNYAVIAIGGFEVVNAANSASVTAFTQYVEQNSRP